MTIVFLIVAVEVFIARAIISKSDIVDFTSDASLDITSLANLRRDALHLQLASDNFLGHPAAGFNGIGADRALLYNDLRSQADRSSNDPVRQAKIKEVQTDLDLHHQLLNEFVAAKSEDLPAIILSAREAMTNANANIDDLYEGAVDGLFLAASSSLQTQRSSQIMLYSVGGLVLLVGGGLAFSLQRSFRSHKKEIAVRAEAQEAERQRNEELETLLNIARIMAQLASSQDRCKNVLDSVARIADAEIARLMIFDPNAQVLRLVVQSGWLTWEEMEEVRWECVSSTAIHSGEYIVVNDYESHPQSLQFPTRYGIKSAVSLPIKAGVQKAPAVLEVMSQETDHFTPERVRLLTAVSDSLSMLLDQDQLSHDLEANLEEMAGIDEVARIITSTLDIEEVYGTFTVEMKKLVPFDEAYLNLLDHETKEYTVRPLHAVVGDDAVSSSVHSPDTNNLAAVRTGDIQNGQDPLGGPETSGGHPPLDLSLGYSIAIPLTAKSGAVGSLELISRNKGAYGPRERVILERLARHISSALENARLFERTRAEEERATAALNQLWAVVDAVDAGIVLTNDGQEILWANRHFGEFFGSGEEENGSISKRDLFADTCVFSDADSNIDNDPKYSGQVESVTITDPLPRTLQRFTAPVGDGLGQHIGRLWVYGDVSDRRRLEEQVLQSQKTETVGRLAGGVAHDFNNMLSVITINAEMAASALAKSKPIYPSVPEYIEDISQAAERATVLTRQLLIFDRRHELKPALIDLDEQISGLYKMLRQLIGENIEFVVPTPADKFIVRVDPVQFEQVLMNLAINASDAMPDGGKFTIETGSVVFDRKSKNRPGDLPPGEYTTVAAYDTGGGISREVREHIFDPFFTTKDSGKGTGLGLALCHGIIEQSNGHIDVASEMGKGTRFTIYLPRVTDAASIGPMTENPAPRPTGSETVLIVEDEPLVLSTAVRVLTEQGYTVLQANNGEEGLRVAKQHSKGPIDLLLTDSIMPQMGGVELAQKLRSLRPSIKVLMTSGYSDYTSRPDSSESSFAFIQKPLSPDSLAHKVREVLEFQLA